MYFNKRKRAPKILKLLVVVLSLGASICFSADKTDIRVGIIDSFNPEFATTTLEPTLGFRFLKASYKPMAEQLRLTLLHKKDQRFGLRFQQSSAVTRIPVSNPPTWARLSTPPLVKPVYKLIRIITIIPCFVIFPTLP